MLTTQVVFASLDDFISNPDSLTNISADFAMVFADKLFCQHEAFLTAIKSCCNGQIIGCSTAGEIYSDSVANNSAVITFVKFEHGCHSEIISDELIYMRDSFAVGERLANKINKQDLTAVLLFGKGVEMNGSAFIEGIKQVLGTHVPITGGLAGDNALFEKTLTLMPDGASENGIAALCLYGKKLTIGYSSVGGWRSFGPARLITKNDQNVLYELDGLPALDVYKKYLGDYAKDLPKSGLLFPFEMVNIDSSSLGLIRTILGIDEDKGSLILAGSVENNGYLRLMQASPGSLVDGAERAAQLSLNAFNQAIQPQLAVLVSCVGRKLVMSDLVEEEIEAIAQTLPENTPITGFYSYGEISPFSDSTESKLHNQTMTVTLIGEEK